MYVKRVRVENYGPIDQLDIELPFDGEKPKPVVLVGENGSGKSIALSHIVNGLAFAKDAIYPKSPEVEQNMVYKLRSSSYIRLGNSYCFSRVDFEGDLYIEELVLDRVKREYPDQSLTASDNMADAWNRMSPESWDHLHSNFRERKKDVRELWSKRCALFFPPNRFEDPAWLNEENLTAHATYMDIQHIEGRTTRRLISYSSLRDNQNWLFDVVFDRMSFESRVQNMSVTDGAQPIVPVHLGYQGEATETYNIALRIVRNVMRNEDGVRFGIGRRYNRTLTVEAKSGRIARVFQLSTGETALLDVFLSILRDYDLSNEILTKAEDVRGVVVVDEIDLHLHAIHQYEVLPTLIQMFPNVQFIVTTHSPLFVLGMNKIFGEQGFVIHRLPSGNQISPEEFSEFESAYQAFRETSRFADDIRTAIEGAQKPVVIMEGATDIEYVTTAASLLELAPLLEKVDLLDGGGDGDLKRTWRSLHTLNRRLVRQRVLVLFDCECTTPEEQNGEFIKKKIPMQNDHPVHKGIENLFGKTTLKKAQRHKPAFIDVEAEHSKTKRGKTVKVPDTWTVNKDEKTNLCNWLCEHGTAEDFQHFRVIFDLIEALVSGEHADPTAGTEPAVVETPKSNNGASRPAGG